MTNRTDLSIRSDRQGDRGAKAQQLALLADSFAQPSALSLIATTLHDGSVSTTAAGPALAKDALLTQALRQAAVYMHTSGDHTPERDFVTLSTSSQTIQIAEALSRLASAFLEVRGTLASTMSQASRARDIQEESPDFDGMAEGRLRLIGETFATVNACFILVISTTHARFDESEQFRRDLSDVFQKLLQCDPFLKQLAPSFETLKSATSPDARKVALRQFFETFCDEAQQPTLYDPAFSAVVQSMLLRELRQIIAHEARLPRGNRVSTPYLAKLFETRLRGELEIARSGSDEPLAVLSALRKCPQELTAIMSTFTNYLLESSDTARKSLTMPDDEAISSEIMLSVGCLLPESGLANRLAGILRQAPDLNPALTLIFASAFKFSLTGPDAPTLDAGLLIDRTLEILPNLSDMQRARAFDEILLPLADECVMRCAELEDLWTAYPAKVQSEFIEKVVVRQIGKPGTRDSSIDPTIDESILKLLQSQLATKPPKEVTMHPVALRWLADQTIQGYGSPQLANHLARIVILQESLASAIGCSESERNALLAIAGGSVLQFLAENPNRQELFVDQLARLSEGDQKTIATAHQLLKRTVLAPLEKALQQYDTLLTEIDSAKHDVMDAEEKQREVQGADFQLAQLTIRRNLVQACLEENVEYLKALQALEKLNAEIDKLQQNAADIANLSTKELFERDEVGRPGRIKERLKERLQEKQILMNREFSLGIAIPNQIKDLRKISLSALEKLDQEMQTLRNKTSSASENLEAADKRKSLVDGALESKRQEVQKLFELANRAVATPIARSLNPAAVHFYAPGAGARLALVVRLHLLSQLFVHNPHSDSRAAAAELERDARIGLAEAIERFRGYQDTLEMFKVFAAMNHTKSPFLASWPEAASASDTDTVYDARSIPESCSFAEYLYQRIRADITSREGTWLTNEPGWDESFHGPILDLFARTLERQDINKEAKARALRVLFQGCCFWVKEHAAMLERRNSESPDQQADIDSSVNRIHVQLRDLLAPWSAVLHVSQGVGARLKAQTEHITRTLVAEAIQLLSGASQQEIDSLYLPLGRRIANAVARADSALFQKKDLLAQYSSALKARQVTLTAERNKAEQAKQEQLERAMPEAPQVAGLEFEKFGANSMHLNLPPPAERRPNSGLLGYNPNSDEP